MRAAVTGKLVPIGFALSLVFVGAFVRFHNRNATSSFHEVTVTKYYPSLLVNFLYFSFQS